MTSTGDSLADLFAALLEEVRRVDPGAASRLRPGLPPEEVRSRLARVPFAISEDAIALYAWADGANEAFSLLPGAYFIPLDEALAEFEEIHAIRDELEEIFPQAYRDNFRFLSDWSDGGYAFGRVDSPSNGQVIALSIHETWHLAFRDLASLLRTSIECYREGLIPPKTVEDFRRYYAIGARLNPGMENWRQ